MLIKDLKLAYQKKLKADWRKRSNGEESPLQKYDVGFLHDPQQRNGIPKNILGAYDFYYDNVESQDWGSVHTYKIKVYRKETYAVRVTTDGDDGCAEIYDERGKALCAA